MASHHDSAETEALITRLERGDRSALGRLVALHRPYLRRLVGLRMEDELRCRLDPSDVVQETQIVASRRIDDFLLRRPTSFRIWLRRKALEQLVDLRRRHLAQKRSVRRDVRLSDVSSLAIARQFVTGRPSQAMRNRELAERVRSAIERLDEFDREVLLLRHVEELTNKEVAELLEIQPATARKRHGRAIRRLGEQLIKEGVGLED